MSDPFIGEIRMFAGNFPPRNWALCNGGILTIASNTALYSLLGDAFGGDGRTTFGLPDFRGRVPVHQGTGAGISPHFMGQRYGVETVTLTINEMPTHGHGFRASSDDASVGAPTGAVLAAQSDGDLPYTTADLTNYQQMNSKTLEAQGGSGAHENMMPFLCVSFIICMAGTYPSRN